MARLPRARTSLAHPLAPPNDPLQPIGRQAKPLFLVEHEQRRVGAGDESHAAASLEGIDEVGHRSSSRCEQIQSKKMGGEKIGAPARRNMKRACVISIE